ncbi:MAG TPA: ABC transporter permease [Candidatus Limnocylindrales bacterium]|nr:ABC transporter permease [Candidatus Limnocylindrales bacterium]
MTDEKRSIPPTEELARTTEGAAAAAHHAYGDLESVEQPEPPARGPGRLPRLLGPLLLPGLALVSAFLVGAIVIIASDERVINMFGTDPLGALGMGISTTFAAYGALLRGAIGDPVQIGQAIVDLDLNALHRSLNPISETILSSTPLVLTGLAVALAFRSGLFNIGAEGQLQVGALVAVLVGFGITGVPWFIHLPLALIGGAIGGALWGFIPGLLKARTGAHEVITTIMLNFIAFRLVDYTLRTPLYQRPGRADQISKIVEPSATLPQFIDHPLLRAHWGIVVALIAAVVVSWLLFRSTRGFEFRAVGLNASAARYAGMSIARTIVLSMMAAGALAGLAGAAVVLGTTRTMNVGLASGAGFDGIAIALLGRARPAGVVAAAFLIGGLRAGATPMQAATGIPIHLVVVLQALVIMFIAAPALVRAIYRIRTERQTGAEAFAKGWGA